MTYVDAELAAVRSSLSMALIKLRRLVESEEIKEDRERKHAIRGAIVALADVARELEQT